MKVTRAARIVLLIICFFFIAPLSRDQEFARRDGTWWMGITRVNKAYYLVGFLDGLVLGNRLSLSGIDKNDKDYKEVSERVTASFSQQRARYLSNLTVIQLGDAMDAFYADSSNRKILAQDAVWLVVNQIAGTPQAEMQAMIESYRKSAATQ